MRRRRTMFATPFVIVIGCSHPAERSQPRAPGAEVDERAAAGHDCDPCQPMPGAPRVRSVNPPPPPSGPSPDPEIVRVVSLQIQGADIVVTVGKGSDDHVDATWRAVLVDEDGTPVGDNVCTIIRVNKRMTLCKATGVTAAQVAATGRMRLSPP